MKKHDGRRNRHRKHAERRLRERLGFNKQDYQEILGMVKSRQYKVVEVQSNTRSVYELTYKDEVLRVVYSKASKQIVTVMTPLPKL